MFSSDFQVRKGELLVSVSKIDQFCKLLVEEGGKANAYSVSIKAKMENFVFATQRAGKN